ncbi:hypothetical protein UFOVP53_197 [uncultured Caudovirales phage]|uniref:Uncharacterized protein n=1 Tax=uncultured Caudovirales phage TaxID=2100421 RepID=A0A6J5KT90_9CAUD|nr:hypothetical protein UFOVP53_197 [uncultured Caudovirales phage]
MGKIKANLLSECIRAFHEVKSVDDIKYDWDGGHAYSYIGGKTGDVITTGESVLSREEFDELDSIAHTWLYDSDDCPPCLFNGECGCNVGEESEFNNGDEVRVK